MLELPGRLRRLPRGAVPYAPTRRESMRGALRATHESRGLQTPQGGLETRSQPQAEFEAERCSSLF